MYKKIILLLSLIAHFSCDASFKGFEKNAFGATCIEGARYYDSHYFTAGGTKISIYDNDYFKKYLLDDPTKAELEKHRTWIEGVIGPKYLDERGNQDTCGCREKADHKNQEEISSLMGMINKKVCAYLENSGDGHPKGNRHPLRSRATAVVASINNEELVVGQIGRSTHAFLCRNGKAIKLTSDSMKYRFKIGDPWRGEAEKIPFFICNKSLQKDDEFLLIVSDGIGDYMSGDEIIGIIKEACTFCKNPEECTRYLVDKAIEKINEKYFDGTDKITHYVRDDITAALVFLKDFRGYVGVFDGTGVVGRQIAERASEEALAAFE